MTPWSVESHLSVLNEKLHWRRRGKRQRRAKLVKDGVSASISRLGVQDRGALGTCGTEGMGREKRKPNRAPAKSEELSSIWPRPKTTGVM